MIGPDFSHLHRAGSRERIASCGARRNWVGIVVAALRLLERRAWRETYSCKRRRQKRRVCCRHALCSLSASLLAVYCVWQQGWPLRRGRWSPAGIVPHSPPLDVLGSPCWLLCPHGGHCHRGTRRLLKREGSSALLTGTLPGRVAGFGLSHQLVSGAHDRSHTPDGHALSSTSADADMSKRDRGDYENPPAHPAEQRVGKTSVLLASCCFKLKNVFPLT